MRSSWLGTAGIALACLPCILVLLVGAGVGAGAISAFGAWFTDSSFVLGAAGVTAVAFAALAWVMYMRNKGGAACEIDPEEENVARSRREPSASTSERPAVTGRNER